MRHLYTPRPNTYPPSLVVFCFFCSLSCFPPYNVSDSFLLPSLLLTFILFLLPRHPSSTCLIRIPLLIHCLRRLPHRSPLSSSFSTSIPHYWSRPPSPELPPPHLLHPFIHATPKWRLSALTLGPPVSPHPFSILITSLLHPFLQMLDQPALPEDDALQTASQLSCQRPPRVWDLQAQGPCPTSERKKLSK